MSSCWHVPTIDDWNTLINYCGGEYEAGCKLKEIGETHWSFNACATNESGFSALPAGARYFYDGTFYKIREIGQFWAADTEFKFGLGSTYGSASMIYWYKQAGFSVRCIKNK